MIQLGEYLLGVTRVRYFAICLLAVLIVISLPILVFAHPPTDSLWCAQAPTRIEVDISTQSMYIYEDGMLIRAVERRITTGSLNPVFHKARKKKIIPVQPRGCFRVLAKDRSSYSRAYEVTIHYVLWFIVSSSGDKLYAFHQVPAGEKKKNELGRPASGGCTRVPTDVAPWLYQWAKLGTPVYIHGYWIAAK